MNREQALEAIKQDKICIDESLSAVISSDDVQCGRLAEAMRYSALGGKRIRGIMLMETARMLGADMEAALKYACAIECVQAYSLIHDDLPCMDNDDFRRGRPSCHKAFGEAAAMLAGDALLTLAFELASYDGCEPENSTGAVSTLASCAGYMGMAGGQMLDLEAAERKVSPEELSTIHDLKTAALFKAAAVMGACSAGANAEDRTSAAEYAYFFGRAFQITDDLLDEDSGELNSYVSVNGESKAREDAERFTQKAQNALSDLSSRGYVTTALETLLDMAAKRIS